MFALLRGRMHFHSTMNCELVDTHAHLDCFEKRGSLADTLLAARANGVGKIIAQSANAGDWNVCRRLARDNENLFWAAGLHPEDITQDSRLQLGALGSFFTDEGRAKPVAVGEIGLDFYRRASWTGDEREIVNLQNEIFETQLFFAKQFDCPVVVHARAAFAECIEVLKRVDVDFSKVVFHCFSGELDDMKTLAKLGGRASFTGIITYKSAGVMRECMLYQGLERVMFETDCPYLSPMPVRGTENSPANLPLTVRFAAEEVFKIPFEVLARKSTSNAEEFFGI